MILLSTRPPHKWNSLVIERVTVFISQACREGIVDVVRTLLHGSVPTINTLDEEGFAPLHYAARYDRATIVQLLINAGAGKVVHCNNLEANQLCSFENQRI